MGYLVLREPVVLYETIEAVYQHVNGISLEKRKNDLLRKYGQRLTPAERERMEDICGALLPIEELCESLPEDPALLYYFQKWETESNWQNICLAKLMVFSFLDIRVGSFQASLGQTLHGAQDRLSRPYILTEINSGGMSFRSPEPGETPPDLVSQLDQLAIGEQYCWKLYKMLWDYPQAMAELRQLLEPLAGRVEQVLRDVMPLARAAYDGWEQYFAQHTFSDLLEHVTNQTVQEDGMDVYINLNLMAPGDIVFTYDIQGETPFRQVYIGALLSQNFQMNRLQATEEEVCSLLRVISDRSKFEILRRISHNSTYCQELSREMNLTTATISRHMGLLLDAGLVRARRKDNRIYYDLERDTLTGLCEMITKILLEP